MEHTLLWQLGNKTLLFFYTYKSFEKAHQGVQYFVFSHMQKLTSFCDQSKTSPET